MYENISLKGINQAAIDNPECSSKMIKDYVPLMP